MIIMLEQQRIWAFGKVISCDLPGKSMATGGWLLASPLLLKATSPTTTWRKFYPFKLNRIDLSAALYLEEDFYFLIDIGYLIRWYFGPIRRVEAEKRLLSASNPHGAFLIRGSEGGVNEFVLSSMIWTIRANLIYDVLMLVAVRDGDAVKHYRIRQAADADDGGERGFYITRRCTFRTLKELVNHYAADADGLCANLMIPCIRVNENPST